MSKDLKHLGKMLACVFLLGASATSSFAAGGAEMVFGKLRVDDKMLFTLNDQSFFPVIYSIFIPSRFTVSDVEALQQQGFNMIYTAIDYPWLETRRAEVENFLAVTAQANMPVIVELGEWDYWQNWLREHPDANMVMSTGDHVTTYADFANPDAREEHLRRFRALSAYLDAYRGHPVVAVSLGAYDYYHIPDGETHADFSVPQHGSFPQTWLPYSDWAQSGYLDFLKAHGFTPSDVGFETWDAVIPPSEWENIQTPLHWSTWMWFRKAGYVQSWLADTTAAVRETSGLPVTVTLDVRPVGWDDWATSSESWAELFDFVIVYYYGMNSPQETRERLQYLYRAYDSRSVPLISLLEFSSTIGIFTSAEDYLNASIPYVSGVQFGFGGSPRHDERRADFLNTALDLSQQGVWLDAPSAAEIGILVSSEDPYVYASYEVAARAAEQSGVSFEAVYDLNDLSSYQLIYVPPNQLLLERQPEYRTRLDTLKHDGITVIEGSFRDLQSVLQDGMS